MSLRYYLAIDIESVNEATEQLGKTSSAVDNLAKKRPLRRFTLR